MGHPVLFHPTTVDLPTFTSPDTWFTLAPLFMLFKAFNCVYPLKKKTLFAFFPRGSLLKIHRLTFVYETKQKLIFV